MTNSLDLKKYIDKENKFIELFNSKTGFYMRTGVIENGKDTGVDPFMRNFPQLIDIGIMGNCVNGRNGICLKAGIECYQNAPSSNKPNMTLENYKKIIDESRGKVFSVALGGAGDPNKHEQFEEILKYSVENGIVPNYTTSGFNLTDKEIELTKKYCGAVAVSEYRHENTRKALERFIAAGVKTNIHYVLGNNTIDEAIHMLKTNSFTEGINAVIFLLHKPVGLGRENNMLRPDDPRVKEFFDLINTGDFHHKIGFDSCSIPGIINHTTNLNPDCMDTCEGGRYSMYITADMVALPCSFDNQEQRWGVDLNNNTIKEAWDSETFDKFRYSLKHSCPSCKDRIECRGGCPIVNEIVLCNREERQFIHRSEIIFRGI